MIKVLFVCMGNICRSPTAEGVFRHLLHKEILDNLVLVDSAGTHAYHVGEPPDQRSQQTALRRGYDLSRIRARKISIRDFGHFDWILAMDRNTLESLRQICPPEQPCRLGLFMEYANRFEEDEVPDPYYGNGKGFDRVLDMVEDAAKGLVEMLKDHTKRKV